MVYNFRTKAYKYYDAHKICRYLFIDLAAVKLSVLRLITYFNYVEIIHSKTLCSRENKYLFL